MWMPDLPSARDIAARSDSPLSTRILAADVLVAHGELDRADRLLAELGRLAPADAHVDTLVRASARLRRFAAPAGLAEMDPMAAQLTGNFEAIVADRDRPLRTILVFTDITERFWLSLPILHLFLEPLEARIIYLKDARNEMFLSGLQGFGGTYAATLAGLAAGLGDERGNLHVLACSAGGFVGLRAAMDLRARSFLGFSVRTDLSPGSALPINGAAARLKRETDKPEMLIDLRPELERKPHPGAIGLYYGASNSVDAAHAAHLDGIGRVRINAVATKSHNSVQHLVAEGGLAAALEAHVTGSEAG